MFFEAFGRTIAVTALIVVAVSLVIGCGLTVAMAGEEASADGDKEAAHVEDDQPTSTDVKMAIVYSVAITIGISCLAAGYAVGKVGAAAMGAAAEQPEIMGRGLVFVGLAEGIAIYGLIIGIMLLGKM